MERGKEVEEDELGYSCGIESKWLSSSSFVSPEASMIVNPNRSYKNNNKKRTVQKDA